MHKYVSIRRTSKEIEQSELRFILFQVQSNHRIFIKMHQACKR